MEKEEKDKNYHKFTEEECQFIKDNYLTMTYEQIGDMIGVSKSSITGKVIRMGLTGKWQINSMDKKGYRIIGSRTRAVCKYHSMLARVRSTREKEKVYRGIKVLVSKEDFIRWYMPRDFVGASVDRIDSKGHYSLDNMQVISMHDNIVKAKKGCAKAHDGVCVCCACGEEKPLDLFGKSKRRPYGHTTLCLECRRKKEKLYRIKKRNERNKI